jgi:hypothetical protein
LKNLIFKNTFLILISLPFLFMSCENDTTHFNKLDRQISTSDDVVEFASLCIEIDTAQDCQETTGCQALFSKNSNEFVSCIETPIQLPSEKSTIIEEDTVESIEEPIEDPIDDQYENINKPVQHSYDELSEYYCKDKKGNINSQKIIICHIPPGNPSALHSICISKQGWLHGHKDAHGNEISSDHLGPCTQRELDVIGDEEV